MKKKIIILIFFILFLIIFNQKPVLAQEPPEITCDSGINGFLKAPSGVPYHGNGTIRIIKNDTPSSYDINLNFGSDGYFNIFRTDNLWSPGKGKFKLIISITEGTQEFSVNQCTNQTYIHNGLQNVAPHCGSYCTRNDDCKDAQDSCTCCAISPGEASGECANPAITQMGPCASARTTASEKPIPTPLKPKFCSIYDPTNNKFLENPNCIQTALGPIPTKPQELLIKLLPWLIGLGGGIAFIMMLLAAFEILTSAGNPEKVKHGKERLTSAIIGLLFVIFSTFILRIIGLPIMNISK